jgi:hypothetical protein
LAADIIVGYFVGQYNIDKMFSTHLGIAMSIPKNRNRQWAEMKKGWEAFQI